MKTLTPALRDALARDRDRYIVLRRPAARVFSGAVRRAAEAALRTLSVDFLDVFQLYWVGKNTWGHRRGSGGDEPAPGGGEGARAGGLDPRPAAGRELAGESILDLLMIRYNAAHPGAEEEIFPYLARRRPAVVAYTATAWRKLLRPPGGWKGKVPDGGRLLPVLPCEPARGRGAHRAPERRRTSGESVGRRPGAALPRGDWGDAGVRARGPRVLRNRKEDQDAIQDDRRDFLRMMGAAAGVAVGGTLSGIPPGASAATGSPPGGLEKRPLGKPGLGPDRRVRRDDHPRSGSDPVRRRAGCGLRRHGGPLHGGENERIVGRALAGLREKVVLATKVKIGTVDEMILSAENSLRSLKTDVIDLLQLHNLSTEAEVTDERAREALSKLIDQGKVRAAGVTTHSGQETVLRAVAKHGFYKTVLAAYSFRSDTGLVAKLKGALELTPGLTKTIREVAASGIGVIAMKTQAGGYASPPGGLSPHQAALAWVLANPGVTMTIPGMTSYAQVEENLGARGKRFALADRIALGRYALEIGDRHCGLCGACGGVCPRGVEVPNVLRALTCLEGYREEDLARSAYGSLPPGRNAAACGKCEACLVACRLRLPVGRLARRAHARLAG